ncbi:macrophage mannose receptor 1 [Astyanax mexicanus]|uniref:macrophage mannose receptor 1 n=1 Tax=Astyanax mexicanus TaxID=7994 RepID=UPI0020CB6736|nr:macrophage mannose receptor 1 [Astyanax mexicanus]
MIVLLFTLCAFLHSALGDCEAGWRPYQDRCYYFSSDTKTWHDALTECQSKNANLMSISDIHERLWVSTQIGTTIFWIGLNDIVSEGNWEWSDGSVYYPYLAYWREGQPDNYLDNEDCGQVDGNNNGQWNDEHCTSKRPYICRRDNPNPTPQCDTANGWEQYGSNCYKLNSQLRKSWIAARTDCVMEGGDLVSIQSAAEQQYVISRLDHSPLDMWIGYSTLKCTTLSCQIQVDGTTFSWSDSSSSSYTNWPNGQPDLTDKQNGVCASMIKDAGDEYGKWKTHVCRYERPYLCKRGLNTICPEGWLSFGGNCYLVVSNNYLLTSWHQAFSRCNSMNGKLLTITSEDEQFFINAQLPDLHQVDIPDVWIGISDMAQDGAFKWVDNTDIQFSNWNSGFPKNTEVYWDCGQIFTGNYAGKWETTNCFKNMAYICKMTGGQNIQPTAAPDFHCDEGYLLYGNYCYHFEAEMSKTWQEAEAYCVSQSGHLASIPNQETTSFITAHMPRSSWVGLNDIDQEGQWKWTDGSAITILEWETGQPDNWQDNEDCVHIRGTEHWETGKLNDLPCTSTFPFICQKAKGQGPPPVPPTSGPGWNEKCGSWVADPFNDYCYLFNSLSLRKWAEARADCVNQGGDLLSITEPFEQGFIQAQIQSIPNGVSLWMGGHDSVTEGGWEWTDRAPFRYINWASGNPDDYYGEDCLTIYINSGYWNDDNCDYKRGYVCKRRGNTPEPPPPHDGFLTVYTCQDSLLVLHCETNSVINIQSAFFGRKSDQICPYLDGSTGTCTIPGVLEKVRKQCDNRGFCFVFANTDNDICPSVSKYMEVVYSCEQSVCVQGLGVEDGTITDSMLSASSSMSGKEPSKGRLNGDSCWMPSSPASNSWIQVTLPESKKITGVVIQGCPTADHWVTKFKVQTSLDGVSWTDYTAEGKVEEFPGSVDRGSAETQLFGNPVSVKYIRILPLEWHNEAGLRFEILGCAPDYAIPCSRTPSLDHSVDKMSVHCPAGCAHETYNVYGTMTYRGDSNICAAAIHAGVVLNEIGGDCTVLKAPGQSFYSGSTRNGITSKQFSGDYSVSFQFADGELRCPDSDWHEFGEFCYRPFDVKKTWYDARSECRKLGADLVSIMSITEQSWLESYLYLATSDVWIGLNDLEFSGYFLWSNNHEVTFTYWAPGEPNNHLGFNEDCVEMYQGNGRWNDVTCTELNTFICKMTKGHYPLPSIKPTVYGCPQGWDAFEYSCYWLEETAMTRAEAKTFCETKDKDSSLLHIGDLYEQAHFTARLASYSGHWWIGLRAKGESAGVDYYWDNGDFMVYSHWDRNQPESGAGPCVTMTTKPTAGFWVNRNCDQSHPFICEIPRDGISPPTKAPTPPPATGCATGWTSLPHFRQCYRLYTEEYTNKKSWAGAHEDCVARGADLVSIHNAEEEIFMAEYTKGKTQWIGLSRNALEGDYLWSDGSALSHTNWGPGEPNDHAGRENCVELVTTQNGSSYWNDIFCDAHQDWVCMIAKGKTPTEPPVPPSAIPAPDCGSNPGWRKNNGICYYYNDTEAVDFFTALERCFHEKALLASILSPEEQTYIVSMVGTGQIAAAWIGMQMFGVAGGEYIWVDLSPITYVHWAPGEPNNANGEEQCVQMNRYPGTWNDANCGRATAGYVCKKLPGEHHTPPPPTQPWEGNCPEGWMRFHNKCYLFKGNHYNNEIKANWSYARDWCRSQQGDLAVIDDINENDFVASYLRDMIHPVWIGLSDVLHEDKFAWSDGVSPVLFTNWAEKEPNNNDGKEHCVSINHNHLLTGRWNDENCNEERGWVCYRKKDSHLPAPPTTKSPCPSDYVSWYKNCYKLVSEHKSWADAEAACVKEGGHLASVDMSYDQAFISGAIQQERTDAWIGLKRNEETSTYQWTDGWPVFYTHWGPGEPTIHKGEGCVSMHGRSHFIQGTWNDTACDVAKPYICKITFEKPPVTPAPGDGECMPGFSHYGRYCYFVYNGKTGFSWPEARHYCQLIKGGDLASVHSRAEVEFIRNINYTKYHNVWLGLTRDGSLGWGWTDLTALAFTNWAPGEPNEAYHDLGMEDCVEMYPDGTWNDNNCFQKRGFACRVHQHYSGDVTRPTSDPNLEHAGTVAGAVIGAILAVALILAVLYYVFRVKGVKLSAVGLPGRDNKRVEVPAFNNPNFIGESDT